MAAIVPRWLKRVATELGGRDPLGLSRVTQLLTDQLLPGIVVNTNRARYYSLYSWALWHIEQAQPAASKAEFIEAFQRREAVIAAATLLAKEEDATAIGSDKVRQLLELAKKSGEYETQIRVLPANALGGYGQYYIGCLHVLGLTHRPREDGIDRVTDGIGRRLAEAVQAMVAVTPYIRGRAFAHNFVELETVRKSQRFSLDAIREAAAAPERGLLVDLFFGLHADGREATTNRRHTLTRLLSTVAAYAATGIAIAPEMLERQLVYAPAYFGVLISEDEKTMKPWRPDAGHAVCTEGWAQFCLHQFLTMALEGMLKGMLQALVGVSSGKTVDELVAELTDARFHDYLRTAAGARCSTPRQLLAAAGVTAAPSPSECEAAQAKITYTAKMGEWLCEAKVDTPSERCARSCLVLAVLYAKWRGSEGTIYRDLARRAGHDLVTPLVLPWLDAWLAPATTWQDALRALLVRIVQHHDRVMYDKGRLESCWIDHRDDCLIHEQDYKPFRRATRHEQAIQILEELGLVEWKAGSGDQHLVLSAAGRRVLERSKAMVP